MSTIESLVKGAGVDAKALLGTDLPACPPDGQSPDTLLHVGRDIKRCLEREAWQLIAPHLVFDPRHYRRVRLWRNQDWEGLLLCWLPGQHTTVHDHGSSTGVTLVLMGDLHEARFAWEGEGNPLKSIGCGDLPRGGVTYELPDTIHEISNESCQPAVSLHLYSAPLTHLGAYDIFAGTRKIVDVADRPDVQVGGNPDLPA